MQNYHFVYLWEYKYQCETACVHRYHGDKIFIDTYAEYRYGYSSVQYTCTYLIAFLNSFMEMHLHWLPVHRVYNEFIFDSRTFTMDDRICRAISHIICSRSLFSYFRWKFVFLLIGIIGEGLTRTEQWLFNRQFTCSGIYVLCFT